MRYLLLLFSTVTLFSCNQSKTTKPPNVILIMTDDQGWGDLSIHGNDSINTPILDRLGEEGVQFDRFFVSPLCAPTRASLLTGRYHLRTGTTWVTRRKEVMRAEEVTIAEVFREAGYRTGIFGKWHNGEQYPNNPQGQGFDEFYGFKAGHWNNYFKANLEHNGKEVKGEGFIIDDLTSHAVDFIQKNKDQPFFCYVPYNTPHSPFQVPDELFDKYKKAGLTDKNACVYAMCENIDNNVGRIWTTVNELGLEENTIIVFLTDNGPNGKRYNGDMKGTKGSVDEGGMRVPLFMYWKNHLPKGKVVKQIASHFDLLPTLAELCEVELPNSLELDGKSLAPLLLEEDLVWEERSFHHIQANGELQIYPSSMRNSQYRLVIDRDKKVALYDMLADPRQTTDLADQLPKVTAEMLIAHQAWFDEVTKQGITAPPIPLGYEESPATFLPAPEVQLSGDLQFEGEMGWANDWIVNWTNTKDIATWKVEVATSGKYQVGLKYACKEEHLGAEIEVKSNENVTSVIINEAHYPAYYESPDRVKRGEVYERDWKIIDAGIIPLEKGNQNIEVQALAIPNKEAMELKGVILTLVMDK